MKSQELRAKTVVELSEILNSKRLEIQSNSINVVKGSEKNIKKNLYLRKEIARIKTILNEKQLIQAAESNENE
jgi:ribosomal protein L29